MRRRSPLRSLLAVLPLPLALLVGAATSTANVAQETAGAKILRVQRQSYPATLDPQRTIARNEVGVSGLDYEGLTRIDADLDTVPGAAESWAFSADGTVLTFTLRENLTYADGSPLTAERFRYAIERACDPRTEAPFATTLFIIAGCEAFYTSQEGSADFEAARGGIEVRALDDRTLELRLVQPAAYLPTVASTAVFYPVRREAVEADPDGWWSNPATRVGNGPFRVVAIEPDRDRPRIAFAASERYWDGRPKLDGIEYVYFVDSANTNDAVEAYRRGEVDIAWPWEQLMPEVEADPVLSKELLRYPEAWTFHFVFNLDQAPFQDRQVRQAFAYAFDRAAYCREIEFGFCVPAHSWIPPGSPGHIESDALAFDPERARRALAESSYGGPENLPEVSWYYFPQDAEDVRFAEWLAALYRSALGVELKLVPTTDEEFDALYESPATWPQLDWGSWRQDYPDPHNWLSVFWTCGSQIHAAAIGYCNPAFDDLVARADRELDPAKRLALYDEAQRLLIDDAPSVFVSTFIQNALVKPDVVGYVVTPADVAFPGWYTPLTIDIEPAA